MRRRYLSCSVALLLALVLVSGCAVKAGYSDSPTGVPNTRYGRPVPKEAQNPSSAGTYDVKEVDERWSMRDGVTLPVYVFYPVPKSSGETFPVIVFVHPWDMDRSLFKSSAREYAARGYISVTYTVRGWFGADGQIGCIDPEHEMKDLSAIITRLSGDRRWRIRTDAKGAVVGVTGYSMGGVHAYLIAPRKDQRSGDPGDPRVRTVVPQHGGCDLLSSIYPNGCVKWAWVSFLLFGVNNGNLFGALMNAATAVLDPDMDAIKKFQALLNAILGLKPSNVTPELARIYDIAVNRRVEEAEYAKSYLKARSARYWCDEEMDGQVEHPITVPTLVVTGWKDDLFTPNEGLNAISSLVDAPAHILITNSGHAGGFGIPFFPDDPIKKWSGEQVARWFDHYLKGADNGIDREPAVTYYRDWDPGAFGTATDWPPAGVQEEPYYLGWPTGYRKSALSALPPSGDQQEDQLLNIGLSSSISLPYFGLSAGGDTEEPPFPERIKLINLPDTMYSYLSKPLEESLTILGVPRLALSYRSTQPFTQLIPVLYEVKPDGTEVAVTRGWYEGHTELVGSTISTESLPIELTACSHRFPTGSRIRLDIQTADLSMSWPYWVFSIVSILHDEGSPPRLLLPVSSN